MRIWKAPLPRWENDNITLCILIKFQNIVRSIADLKIEFKKPDVNALEESIALGSPSP